MRAGNRYYQDWQQHICCICRPKLLQNALCHQRCLANAFLRNTLLQYLQNLSEARLIQLLYSDVTNVKRLQKPDKIYLENTNMLHALATTQVNEGTEREVFFINQLSAAHVVEYSKTSADFTIDHQYTIKVGGRSKDGKQIAGVANSFIASADEEYVLGNKIPLWLFGFLY